MIEYLNTAQCKPLIKEFFALARKKFRGILMYEPDHRTIERWYKPHSLQCAAYDTEKREVVSYFTWTITDTRFRDDLISGKAEENDLHVYDERYPPVLFFNTFVVTDAHHSPYIIRHLIRDLKALVKADFLNIVGGLSIGGLRFTEKWLRRYNFQEAGRYRGLYPILWATREQSPILDSLCAPARSFTFKPWPNDADRK